MNVKTHKNKSTSKRWALYLKSALWQFLWVKVRWNLNFSLNFWVFGMGRNWHPLGNRVKSCYDSAIMYSFSHCLTNWWNQKGRKKQTPPACLPPWYWQRTCILTPHYQNTHTRSLLQFDPCHLIFLSQQKHIFQVRTQCPWQLLNDSTSGLIFSQYSAFLLILYAQNIFQISKENMKWVK